MRRTRFNKHESGPHKKSGQKELPLWEWLMRNPGAKEVQERSREQMNFQGECKTMQKVTERCYGCKRSLKDARAYKRSLKDVREVRKCQKITKGQKDAGEITENT